MMSPGALCASCGLWCLLKTTQSIFALVMAVLGTLELARVFPLGIDAQGNQFVLVMAVLIVCVQYLSIMTCCISV
jgi:hypothetical protein